MKTIKELNNKVWYRLLKVIYILSIILVSCVSIGLTVSDHSDLFDGSNSYILCNNGIKIRPEGLNSPYITSLDDEKYREACKSFDNSNVDFTPKYSNYELVESRISFDWYQIIKYSMLYILITFLFFEVVRRIFYYIVLGKLRPQKD